MQNTLKSTATLTGQGLHSGQPVTLTVHPAPADHGIVFIRTDIVEGDARISATWDRVVPSRLCTLIANDDGVSVSTIEHVMAALAGCAITNAVIEVDGPEVPILDGSAAPFAAAFLRAGIVEQDAPLQVLRVLRAVEVREGEAVARLEPAPSLEMQFSIDFADAAIGRQQKALTLANGTFLRELSDSRTFCRQADVDAMRRAGLALGGTLENAVVVEGDRVLSPGGLRHRDEPVRHKMLDALGDLSLAGAPILGRYIGTRAGHALTNKLLRALFADPLAYRMEGCAGDARHSLPGVGVHLGDLPACA